jgi:hypothetical protein
MKSNKLNRLLDLTKKTTSVFGAAFAALTGLQFSETSLPQHEILDNKSIQVNTFGKVKPMPVLKLNAGNLENSQLIAQHRSHSSHSSHRSHSSHYSHRSGAMFS